MRFELILLLLFSVSCWSQSDSLSVKMYSWEDVQGANPDTIFGISLTKMKLEELPIELKQFVHLRKLDISKNKLIELPDFIKDFKSLKVLNAGRNKLEYFPIQLCSMKSVERLILNRNAFTNLPMCISNISELRYLDLYDTPIKKLPLSLEQMKNLEEIDFTGIRFSPTFQEGWINRLPNVKLIFDAPCDCLE